ncbi:MAG: methionine--tRNA ligase [Bacteroidetes bacterium]|nr:methionine--tRNA ligase [Bacteroidota bacterium]
MSSDNTGRKRFLVTAALPYANGPIHIGHLAGAYLPADLYCRYRRLRGDDVVFICGSDELGVAIMVRARNEGVEPLDIVNRYHPVIKKSFADFGISFDYYGRTTSETHRETSQSFFNKLAEGGNFTLKEEQQLFDPQAGLFLADRFVVGTCPNCGFEEANGDQCERCGTTLSPSDLINPRSTLSDAVPEMRSTTHWYLPLGKFQERLEDWHSGHADWKPNVMGQIRSWLADGLRERAITRDVPWGVPVPRHAADLAGVDANGKVIYVWFDAPIGYISATKEWAEQQGDPDRWKDYWQDSESTLLHFIGKDNIVFHCIMFPAMLMAHGEYILPQNVPANEFLNLEGRKLSTSRGWAVWLHEYLDEFDPDLLRYALAATLPEAKDADFSWKDFQARVNGELADVLGNFVNRTMTFAHRFYSGTVPELSNPSTADADALSELHSFPDRIGNAYDAFRMREAVFETMALARLGNKYFNDTEPWKTRKDNPQACANTVHVSLQICASICVLADPVIPFAAARLRSMLGLSGRVSADGTSASAIHWADASEPLLKAGHPLGEAEILFEKIDDDVIERQIAKLVSRSAEGSSEPALPFEPARDEIEYDDFAKLDLRMGTVIAADRVPKADKLLRLDVDLGYEKRQILSGVAEQMKPEELVGRRVVVVANLKPRRLRGFDSAGMLLMAEDRDGKLCLIESAGEDGAVVR